MHDREVDGLSSGNWIRRNVPKLYDQCYNYVLVSYVDMEEHKQST